MPGALTCIQTCVFRNHYERTMGGEHTRTTARHKGRPRLPVACNSTFSMIGWVRLQQFLRQASQTGVLCHGGRQLTNDSAWTWLPRTIL